MVDGRDYPEWSVSPTMLVGPSALSDSEAHRAGSYCGGHVQFLPHGTPGNHPRNHEAHIDRERIPTRTGGYAAGRPRGAQKLSGSPRSRPISS